MVNNLIELRPLHIFMEATILAKMGSYSHSMQLIETLLIQEKRPEYFLLKGKILVQTEKFKEAMEAFLEIKESDAFYEEAQAAYKKLVKFTSGERLFLIKAKSYMEKKGSYLMLLLVSLIFIMILGLIASNFRTNHNRQVLSEKYENSYSIISNKIDSLDNEIRKTNLMTVKLDSLSSDLRELFKMNTKLNVMKGQLTKLKRQVDTLSRKSQIKP